MPLSCACRRSAAFFFRAARASCPGTRPLARIAAWQARAPLILRKSAPRAEEVIPGTRAIANCRTGAGVYAADFLGLPGGLFESTRAQAGLVQRRGFDLERQMCLQSEHCHASILIDTSTIGGHYYMSKSFSR